MTSDADASVLDDGVGTHRSGARDDAGTRLLHPPADRAGDRAGGGPRIARPRHPGIRGVARVDRETPGWHLVLMIATFGPLVLMLLACAVGRGVHVFAGLFAVDLPDRADPVADRDGRHDARPRPPSRGSGTSSTSRRSPACSPSRCCSRSRGPRSSRSCSGWCGSSRAASPRSSGSPSPGRVVRAHPRRRAADPRVGVPVGRGQRRRDPGPGGRIVRRGRGSGCGRAGARSPSRRSCTTACSPRSSRPSERRPPANARSPSGWRARRSPGSRTPSRMPRKAATTRAMLRLIADEIEAGARELGVDIEVRAHDRLRDDRRPGPRRARADARVRCRRSRMPSSTPTAHGLAVRAARGPGPTRVRIEVRDTGSGFDLEAVPDDRLGIRASIIARVAAVGGTTRIASGEHGTTVRLEWREPAAMISVRGVLVGLAVAFTAYLAARGLWWTEPVPYPLVLIAALALYLADDLAVRLLGAGPAGTGSRAEPPPTGARPNRAARRGRACSRWPARSWSRTRLRWRGRDSRTAPFATWYLGGIGALMTIVMVRRRPWVAWAASSHSPSRRWRGWVRRGAVARARRLHRVGRGGAAAAAVDGSRGAGHRPARAAAACGVRLAGVAGRASARAPRAGAAGSRRRRPDPHADRGDRRLTSTTRSGSRRGSRRGALRDEMRGPRLLDDDVRAELEPPDGAARPSPCSTRAVWTAWTRHPSTHPCPARRHTPLVEIRPPVHPHLARRAESPSPSWGARPPGPDFRRGCRGALAGDRHPRPRSCRRGSGESTRRRDLAPRPGGGGEPGRGAESEGAGGGDTPAPRLRTVTRKPFAWPNLEPHGATGRPNAKRSSSSSIEGGKIPSVGISGDTTGRSRPRGERGFRARPAAAHPPKRPQPRSRRAESECPLRKSPRRWSRLVGQSGRRLLDIGLADDGDQGGELDFGRRPADDLDAECPPRPQTGPPSRS